MILRKVYLYSFSAHNLKELQPALRLSAWRYAPRSQSMHSESGSSRRPASETLRDWLCLSETEQSDRGRDDHESDFGALCTSLCKNINPRK